MALYDAANRLTSVGGVTYTWDARGNLSNDGVFTYTYNAASRMVQAESVTVTLVYTYNAQGLRVSQSVDGDVTTFAWDWASGIPEMLSEGQAMGSSIALYLVGRETLGQWDGSEWVYYLPDALGSIRQTADDTGAVTDSREWTPFGVEVGAVQEGLGYTGEWKNSYLLPARFGRDTIHSSLRRSTASGFECCARQRSADSKLSSAIGGS